MTRFHTLAAFAICVLVSQTAHAGVLSSLLSFNGIPDKIIDDSVGLIQDLDGSNRLSVGDVIQGIIRMTPVDADSNGGAVDTTRVYAAYSLEVADTETFDVDLFGDGSLIVPVPVLKFSAASGDYALKYILGEAGFDVSFTDADKSIFAVFESTVDYELADFSADNPGADGDPTRFLTGGGATIANQIAENAIWTLDLVTGLLGDDFYEVTVDIGALGFKGKIDGPLSPITDKAIRESTDPDPLGSYKSASSVLFHNFGSSIVFLPQSVTSNLASTGTADGDLITAGANTVSRIDGDVPDNARDRGWDYEDRGDFSINAVPEPGAILSFGSMVAIAAFGVRLRRKS